METVKEQWTLWACNCCGSTMKINKIADKEDFDRFKDCIPTCGGELEYVRDLGEYDDK